MKEIKFLDRDGTFQIRDPENYSYLYFPLAGEGGLKSSITPNLGGDSKLDQNHFLLEPVSVENLHNNRGTRNFWCRIKGKGSWSVCGMSAEQEGQKFTEAQDESILEAGFMWQKISRKSEKYGLEAAVTSFVPKDENVEVTLVEIKNVTDKNVELTPIAVFPIFGRSADNIRDHRHVTSLLHRIRTTDNGVIVTPVLSFDERGHQKNDTSYYVYGFTEAGEGPEDFYPTVEKLLGEGGSYLIPEAVRTEKKGDRPGTKIQGKEAAGGIRYLETVLKPGESTGYIVLAGVAEGMEMIDKTVSALKTKEQVLDALEKTRQYWIRKVNVEFQTNSSDADNYLKWICFQPILRRIYGCSFLPYHDYGKGGRGWRDLWQDCLALLFMEPTPVRQMIVDHYGGVRMDGTNATIIGSQQGEFTADRNNITRVWMDHAFWPFMTTKLYIDQTGDLDILLEKTTYFKDIQVQRGTKLDRKWDEAYGHRQRTILNEVYFGTILEHILLQNLCAFYDVGEHNQIRLHGADWNDALDMAKERGESVAFTCAYAGNLKEIAAYMRKMRDISGIEYIELAEEMSCLLVGNEQLYEDPDEKNRILETYEMRCIHNISGNTIIVDIEEVSRNIEEKAKWLMEHIRKQEWISNSKGQGWFNGYYDNHGKQVEGCQNGNVRMMLTGQVFAMMSGTAQMEQIQKICESADEYLYDEKAGGYRLNTDFKEEKFDLGRMFGFAYGEKENGAVFSHMAVMYANALYKRGYAKEGHKAMRALLDTAMKFKSSRIYPGLPEYFDNNGRGMYPYLTGAASWYMLTMITEVFGVRGELGDLMVAPALMAEQFDENGNAVLQTEFAGKRFQIHFSNPQRLDFGEYKIMQAVCGSECLERLSDVKVCLNKEQIKTLDADSLHQISVTLG